MVTTETVKTLDPVTKTNLLRVKPASCINAACRECGETLPQKSQVLGTAVQCLDGRSKTSTCIWGVGGVGMYIYVIGHVCTCVEARGQASAVIPQEYSTLNFETGSHWPGYHQPVQLGGLAQEPQKSSCLCLPNSEATSVHQNSQLLVWALRSWLLIGSRSDICK